MSWLTTPMQITPIQMFFASIAGAFIWDVIQTIA
jgi:hypothetical protein